MQAELKQAMLDKNKIALEVYRFTISTIKNAAIELGVAPETLEDTKIDEVLAKVAKQRQESIESFKKGNREDLVKNEEDQLKVLEKYLPKQMNDEEVKVAVEEAIKESGAKGMQDIGNVMGVLKKKYGSELDMGLASKLVRENLG